MIAWAIQAEGHYVYVSNGSEEDRPLTFMTNWDDFYGTWADFVGVMTEIAIAIDYS